MGLLYGRAGRLTTENGGFRPGQGDSGPRGVQVQVGPGFRAPASAWTPSAARSAYRFASHSRDQFASDCYLVMPPRSICAGLKRPLCNAIAERLAPLAAASVRVGATRRDAAARSQRRWRRDPLGLTLARWQRDLARAHAGRSRLNHFVRPRVVDSPCRPTSYPMPRLLAGSLNRVSCSLDLDQFLAPYEITWDCNVH